jgi:hypothetical protein
MLGCVFFQVEFVRLSVETEKSNAFTGSVLDTQPRREIARAQIHGHPAPVHTTELMMVHLICTESSHGSPF